MLGRRLTTRFNCAFFRGFHDTPAPRHDPPINLASRDRSNVLPRIGRRFPIVTAEMVLPSKEITTFNTLEGQTKSKFSVFNFFPGCFSQVCPTEVCAFGKSIQNFEKLGCQIFGVVVADPEVVQHWISTDPEIGGAKGIKFPIICDHSQRLSKYSNSFDYTRSSPNRSTFIIDSEGFIRYFQFLPKNIGRSVSEITRIASCLKHIDEHIDRCTPANWQPNDRDISINEPNLSEYFENCSTK
ncbi:MAG: hypothetical protein MHPSP_000353 [Paramarteilia canceri]